MVSKDSLVYLLQNYVERLNKSMEIKDYNSMSEDAAIIAKMAYACLLIDNGKDMQIKYSDNNSESTDFSIRK